MSLLLSALPCPPPRALQNLSRGDRDEEEYKGGRGGTPSEGDRPQTAPERKQALPSWSVCCALFPGFRPVVEEQLGPVHLGAALGLRQGLDVVLQRGE